MALGNLTVGLFSQHLQSSFVTRQTKWAEHLICYLSSKKELPVLKMIMRGRNQNLFLRIATVLEYKNILNNDSFIMTIFFMVTCNTLVFFHICGANNVALVFISTPIKFEIIGTLHLDIWEHLFFRGWQF